MKRTFNYTGRIKIDQNRITYEYSSNGDCVLTIKDIKIADYTLAGGSELYAEIFYRNEYLREKIGTVDNIKLPYFISLKDLSYRENLSFRIIVVEQNELKILASTSVIKPANISISEDVLLPLKYQDLGKVVWRIDYECESVDKPVLLINSKIPGIEKTAVSDPVFIMNVYPAVLRDILQRIIFIEKINPNDDLTSDWCGQWLKYATKLNKRENMPEIFIDDVNYSEQIKDEWYEWIENVVDRFCDKRKEWDSYISKNSCV
ncbi:MAG: hypothetical protein ACP5T0_03085 [Verrucomicrobiia bacterium]